VTSSGAPFTSSRPTTNSRASSELISEHCRKVEFVRLT
jgi:hypothetical protein